MIAKEQESHFQNNSFFKKWKKGPTPSYLDNVKNLKIFFPLDDLPNIATYVWLLPGVCAGLLSLPLPSATRAAHPGAGLRLWL